MTTGAFCHYLPIYKDINGDYCSTTLTDALFARYFGVVDYLYVITRVYPLNCSYKEAHQERITNPNVKVIEMENLSTIKGFFFKLKKAKKKIQEIVNEVDLVFVRGGIIALLGVDAAKKSNKKYLMECAGCSWDEYWNHSLLGKILAPYMEYREKKDTRDASCVIYVTERWLQNRYPSKGITTYASNVILSEVDENCLQRRMSKLGSFDKKHIRIGTTGGVGTKAKGQQFVIQAMEALKNRYDITYELVGGGDSSFLKGVAQKYSLSDKVIFRGQMTHEEVLEWLDEIDIYIQPSMQEGLPRALIEAMSRACPAIGSTTAGIPELLEPEMIFNRGNVSELIWVMESAINSDLRNHSKVNFEKSKEYQIDVLNERRNLAYKKYKEMLIGE